MRGYSPKIVAIMRVILVFSLSACAGLDINAFRESLKTNIEDGWFIEGVENVRQTRYMCGPSALTSVLNYYGRKVTVEEVEEKVYLEKIKGTLSLDMVIYAKELGFKASYYSGGLEDLKKRVRENSPLILFINLGYREFPVGHYVVIVGYSDAHSAVVMHSGGEREKVVSYRRLLKAWEKTNFSTILITPNEDDKR